MARKHGISDRNDLGNSATLDQRAARAAPNTCSRRKQVSAQHAQPVLGFARGSWSTSGRAREQQQQLAAAALGHVALQLCRAAASKCQRQAVLFRATSSVEFFISAIALVYPTWWPANMP